MDRTKYNPSKQYQAEEKKHVYTDIFIFFEFVLSSPGSIAFNMQTNEGMLLQKSMKKYFILYRNKDESYFICELWRLPW